MSLLGPTPRGGKEYCNQCGHTPPAGVTAKRTARPAAQAVQRSSAPAPRAKAAGPAVDNDGFTSVPGSKRGRRAAARSDNEISRLQKEVADLKALAKAGESEGGAGGELVEHSPMELDGVAVLNGGREDATKAALRLAAEKAKARWQHLKALPEVLREEGYAAQLLEAEVAAKAADELHKAHGASTASRLAYLLREEKKAERGVAAAADAAKSAADAVTAAAAALAAAQAKAAEAEAAMQMARTAAAAAKAKRVEMAAAPDAEPARSATDTTTAAPGAPPVGEWVQRELAEQLWKEREDQFAAQLAAVRAEVAAASAADEEETSTAADPDDVADLASLDEAARARVRGRRKAAIGCDRAKFAKRIAGLSGLEHKVAKPAFCK